jgi:predicted nucleic acid-binding OB-fold protein
MKIDDIAQGISDKVLDLLGLRLRVRVDVLAMEVVYVLESEITQKETVACRITRKELAELGEAVVKRVGLAVAVCVQNEIDEIVWLMKENIEG